MTTSVLPVLVIVIITAANKDGMVGMIVGRISRLVWYFSIFFMSDAQVLEILQILRSVRRFSRP